MVVLFILLFVVVFYAGLWLAVDWTVHISISKYQGKPYDWCTFKTFMREFDKYKNHPKLKKGCSCDKHSIFLREKAFEHMVYLHASIIEFNGKCMILYPFSYIRYCIWKYNFTKHNRKSNRQKGLWKE